MSRTICGDRAYHHQVRVSSYALIHKREHPVVAAEAEIARLGYSSAEQIRWNSYGRRAKAKRERQRERQRETERERERQRERGRERERERERKRENERARETYKSFNCFKSGFLAPRPCMVFACASAIEDSISPGARMSDMPWNTR